MRKSLLALAVCAISVCSGAQAAEAPGQWYVAPMASAFWGDSSRFTDDDFGGHLALGHAFEKWNLEFGGFYYDLDGNNSTELWGAGVDALGVWYRDRRITPFMLAGFGYTESNNQEIRSDSQNMYVNGGLGLLIDLTKERGLALRTELRYRLDFQSPTQNDWVGNIGLQIPFGGKEEPKVAMVDPDSDGDGVPDSRDKCPGTPAGVRVDNTGCPLDSDGDGVPDYLDKCPGTPSGTPVDDKGCPLDSDGDGVLDVDDECPGTPPGTRVDSKGCPLQAVTALEGVEFGSDSADLTPASEVILDATAAELARHPDMKVEIAGHTSSTGPAEYNQALSERRAQAVADYLISKGLSADRFTVTGYGESDPVADNSSREGRARNRRVEMRIEPTPAFEGGKGVIRND
jgi:OOP family OmpA-OmpF porin